MKIFFNFMHLEVRERGRAGKIIRMSQNGDKCFGLPHYYVEFPIKEFIVTLELLEGNLLG